MGQSTDGQISYGVYFEEGFEFPWSEDKYEGDIDDWWRDVNGYKPPFEPFTEEGHWAEGFSTKDPRMKEYHGHRMSWDEDNPIPVELVNACSCDYPEWIVSIPGTVTRCNRGYPTQLEPENGEFDVSKEDIENLMAFFEKYGIECPSKPAWYLSSYLG